MNLKFVKSLLCIFFIASGLFLCTISDNLGEPATPSGPEIDDTQMPKITVMPFNAIASGDTLSITIFVWSDTIDTNSISDALVDVSVSDGWISNSTIITNNNGYATIEFSDTLLQQDEETREIIFSYSGIETKETIIISSRTTTLQQRFMTISAQPYVINADGVSTSTISLKIKNENFNPMVGDEIIFTTDAGDITASSITNNSGVATATLTSERRNVTALVTATLAKDITQEASVEVEFTGINLTASANPKSIIPNGTDSSIITITLQDASGNAIYGERVDFSLKAGSSAVLTVLDSVTDTRGQAQCYVSGTGSGKDTIIIKSAGDSSIAVISYSSNYLTIDTIPASGKTHSYIANGFDSTRISITYLASNRTSPISNAKLYISVTSGNIDTLFTKITTTNSNGKSAFYLKNPDFATTATITVTAEKGSQITSSELDVYFRASSISRIELNGSPEVISTGGDIAIITATAYDVKDNRVKDDVISFQLKSGPGAGEHLNPPTAITDESGRAVTNLVSGTSPSEQQDVWVIASTFTGIKSNTFKFTIAGPPAYVTFRKDIARITQNSDGTYSKKCVALVTDVNRNPVADGTPVTFSLQITGFIVYKKIGYYMPGLKSYNISDTGYVLPFEDFNDNYERDFYENDRSGYPLYRGEDIVYAANDKDYNPGSPFYDINCNGRRDYDPSFINYERPEPCTTVTMQRIITLYDTITVDSIVQRDSSFSVDSTVFADFNYNNKLDTYEPLVDNQMTDAEYEAGAGFIPGFGYPDIDWNNNNVPDPATTVIITKNIETDNGKAPNMITFGQTDALRIRVKVWVESEGVSSASPEEFTLPIMEDDVKYFNPFYGKKYY